MAKKEKAEEKIEREFVVSLSALFNQARKKRARRAITRIKRFVFKHFRVAAENVSISQALNQHIWKKGREHIPRRIEVKVIKEGEKARVYLKGEKIEKPREKKKEEEKKKETKEEKEAKEEIERKKEEKKAKEQAAEAAAIKRHAAKGEK